MKHFFWKIFNKVVSKLTEREKKSLCFFLQKFIMQYNKQSFQISFPGNQRPTFPSFPPGLRSLVLRTHEKGTEEGKTKKLFAETLFSFSRLKSSQFQIFLFISRAEKSQHKQKSRKREKSEILLFIFSRSGESSCRDWVAVQCWLKVHLIV